MSIIDEIRKDSFQAMKGGDDNKAGILKVAIAELKNEEIKRGDSLSDDDVIKVLRTLVKSLSEAIEQFKAGGRQDLVDSNVAQVKALEVYLPQLMSREAIVDIVKAKANEIGAQGPQDTGRLMGIVMKEISKKADGSLVSEVVREILG